MRREADDVEDPDPLSCGESPAEAESELAVAHLVDDRVGGDAALPLVSVVERRKVHAVVEYGVADAVARLEAAVEDGLDLAVCIARVFSVEEQAARGGLRRGGRVERHSLRLSGNLS